MFFSPLKKNIESEKNPKEPLMIGIKYLSGNPKLQSKEGCIRWQPGYPPHKVEKIIEFDNAARIVKNRLSNKITNASRIARTTNI